MPICQNHHHHERGSSVRPIGRGQKGVVGIIARGGNSSENRRGGGERGEEMKFLSSFNFDQNKRGRKRSGSRMRSSNQPGASRSSSESRGKEELYEDGKTPNSEIGRDIGVPGQQN